MPHFSSAVGFGSTLHTIGDWKMFVLLAKLVWGQSWRNHQQNGGVLPLWYHFHYELVSFSSFKSFSCQSPAPVSELLLWPTGDENSVLIMSPSTSSWRDETKEAVCCHHSAYGLLLRQHFKLWLRAPTHTSASSFSLAHSQLPRKLLPFEIISGKVHQHKTGFCPESH